MTTDDNIKMEHILFVKMQYAQCFKMTLDSWNMKGLISFFCYVLHHGKDIVVLCLMPSVTRMSH
jgi:hypothetical protein